MNCRRHAFELDAAVATGRNRRSLKTTTFHRQGNLVDVPNATDFRSPNLLPFTVERCDAVTIRARCSASSADIRSDCVAVSSFRTDGNRLWKLGELARITVGGEASCVKSGFECTPFGLEIVLNDLNLDGQVALAVSGR